MDENQLINFVLRSRSKDKETILWLCYPELQRMVYSELNEEDCSLEIKEKRCKAIIKAYQILLDFNRGNYHNLYVLHNDVMHFYAVIGNPEGAKIHQIESQKYEGNVIASKYIVNGKEVTPIKMRESSFEAF